MNELKIRIYPDKALRKKASPIKNITKDIKELASAMLEIMHSAGGIGLAAPQVGISKRIIVIDRVENMADHLVLIDPKIIKKKGRCSFCEGCLSVPEVTSDVIRPKEVIVEGLALDGHKVRIEAGNLLARVLQHEIDHLDGIVFLDRVSFFRRKKIIKDLSKKVCVEL